MAKIDFKKDSIVKTIESIKIKLKQTRDEIIQYADEAIQYEKQNHPYQNRTGNLEASTQYVVYSNNENLLHVNLEMNMFYASFVLDKGFSLIDQAAEDMYQKIEDLLTDVGR